jgi:hypothetical protein
MTTNDVTIRTQPAKLATDRRPTRRMIAIGAATLVAAAAVSIGIVRISDSETSVPAVRPRPDAEVQSITEDLVDRGLVPRQTLEARPRSRDEIVRDLVDRGLVPQQTLQPMAQSRDDIVRELIERGLVPAATMDN